MTKLIMGPERPDGLVWFYTGLRLRPQSTIRARIAQSEFEVVQDWCLENLHKRDWWAVNCNYMAQDMFSNYAHSQFSYAEREMKRADHEYVFVMEMPEAAFHFRLRWS